MKPCTQFQQGRDTPFNRDFPTIWTHDAGNEPKQCTLSDAVASDKPDSCTAANFKRDIAQHQVAFLVFSSFKAIQSIVLKPASQKPAVRIALRDIFEFDRNWRGVHLLLPPSSQC